MAGQILPNGITVIQLQRAAFYKPGTMEPAILEDVAKILRVPVDVIRNLDEEGAINIIATTFNSHDNSFAHQCTFNINPIEKWMEALDENKKLYERLLQTEREKVALLEKMLEKK